MLCLRNILMNIYHRVMTMIVGNGIYQKKKMMYVLQLMDISMKATLQQRNRLNIKKYGGMYLYAEYINKHTKEIKRTEFIRLSSDMEEMINLNSPFDKLSIYDKKGNAVEI